MSIEVDNGDEGISIDLDQGLQGATGAKGDTGDTGATGSTGATGASGTNGTDGVDGKSAYEVAVANGYSDSEGAWLASLVGDDGEDGTDGTDGTDGNNGANGVDGMTPQYEFTYDEATGNLEYELTGYIPSTEIPSSEW